MPDAPPIIDSLAQIADRYDALLCDLWGCLHDGTRAHDAAVAALRDFRARGGRVILMTNAPRPSSAVIAQLDRLGAPRDCYDGVLSSGDVARAAVEAGEWGRKVHHIGAPKDEPFFEGLDVERVPLDQAESVICTGLRDDLTETPEMYRDILREAQLRRLPMLCANPDVVVDMGDKRLWCAGALARDYAAMGGRATGYGKPHAPIYDAARRMLAEMGAQPDDSRILCIGDGIATDIAGGVAEDLDTLFVTGGIAAAELGADPDRPEPERLARFCARHRVSPRWAIARLR
ncbi:TIGR01459 family HAD-type hydrolase [Oceanicella actignis]|uniref:HAD-superfamily class IIA hydrolase, TIGR01459 n=1 Tax=Oceanicella actignis TaxID=1189325 RepID=A0A1M7T611_9RHOB|nr:TIGR01459 family HAD-type hydrolase [Oceanicella actignis]TYO84847.1 HAD superfamily hydrolase (TIGR01459 family) [Oceanicella actignis]SET43946.1 HAD-superfamily class IIA hydrolase, TIGR01459 [Oceanicella actignis]SHN66137.1 HAD-superfamily class IIA hydrolase, TIGR01459 [Oceanicella actignis]